MYTPVLVQPCDVVVKNEQRLTRAELTEFQIQFAANQGCSEDAETWLDECCEPALTIVDAHFFFDPLL